MNERGRDVLVKAALDGVPQIQGVFRDERGGRCAMGVLNDALCAMKGAPSMFGLGRGDYTCPECETFRCSYECDMIIHFNDDHRFDFLTIARKLGDVPAGPAS